jgi:glycosyltransferase involved in cell wall biosynthesis
MPETSQPSAFPLCGESIVCLAGEDWWYHPIRSRRHLMTRLARHNRVLFVNSIGMRMPGARPGAFAPRVIRKLRSWTRGLRRVAPNLWVFSPIALPAGGAVNASFVRAQVRLAMRLCGIRQPIVWLGLPAFAPLIGRLGERLLVYHASDRFDAYQGVDAQHVADAQQRCMRSADLVVAVSWPLADLAHANGARRVKIVTHGVDVDHFTRARHADCAVPEPLQAVPRPRLGYLGSLEVFQDLDLLERIARDHPAWRLVFVGPNQGDMARLSPLPNVHFLPACPYEQAPDYLAGFDLCMIPRKPRSARVGALRLARRLARRLRPGLRSDPRARRTAHRDP